MNAHQALTKLRKAIGPKIGWHENNKALDAAGRAAADIEATKLREQERALKAEVDALRAKLLDVPEYIELCKRLSIVRKRADNEQSASHRYRITVGKSMDIFFHVIVEGDNWEDVIARAKEKGILK